MLLNCKLDQVSHLLKTIQRFPSILNYRLPPKASQFSLSLTSLLPLRHRPSPLLCSWCLGLTDVLLASWMCHSCSLSAFLPIWNNSCSQRPLRITLSKVASPRYFPTDCPIYLAFIILCNYNSYVVSSQIEVSKGQRVEHSGWHKKVTQVFVEWMNKGYLLHSTLKIKF